MLVCISPNVTQVICSLASHNSIGQADSKSHGCVYIVFSLIDKIY